LLFGISLASGAIQWFHGPRSRARMIEMYVNDIPGLDRHRIEHRSIHFLYRWPRGTNLWGRAAVPAANGI
jgi:hypothetical protein